MQFLVVWDNFYTVTVNKPVRHSTKNCIFGVFGNNFCPIDYYLKKFLNSSFHCHYSIEYRGSRRMLNKDIRSNESNENS